MRWRATYDSSVARELSVLALVECIFATACYVGVGVLFNTWIHLAIAIACAPLFLVRTPRSLSLAIRGYYGVCAKVLHHVRYRGFTRVESLFHLLAIYADTFSRYLLCAIVGLCIRAAVTMFCLFRHPSEALAALPSNWIRQTLCSDLSLTPEAVPGESHVSGLASLDELLLLLRRTLVWLGSIKSTSEKFGSMFGRLLGYSVTALIYLPVIALRISFKATTVAYAPLVFVAHTVFGSKVTLAYHLDRVVSGELEKVRRYFSLAILGILAAKLLVLSGIVAPSVAAEIAFNKSVVAQVLQIRGWPARQVALCVEASITFALFYFSDTAKARIKDGHPWSENSTLSVLRGLLLTRNVLVTYSILYWYFSSMTVIHRAVASIFVA